MTGQRDGEGGGGVNQSLTHSSSRFSRLSLPPPGETEAVRGRELLWAAGPKGAEDPLPLRHRELNPRRSDPTDLWGPARTLKEAASPGDLEVNWGDTGKEKGCSLQPLQPPCPPWRWAGAGTISLAAVPQVGNLCAYSCVHWSGTNLSCGSHVSPICPFLFPPSYLGGWW